MANKLDEDYQADPKKVMKLMRCDICNKVKCKCGDPDRELKIGFRLDE